MKASSQHTVQNVVQQQQDAAILSEYLIFDPEVSETVEIENSENVEAVDSNVIENGVPEVENVEAISDEVDIMSDTDLVPSEDGENPKSYTNKVSSGIPTSSDNPGGPPFDFLQSLTLSDLSLEGKGKGKGKKLSSLENARLAMMLREHEARMKYQTTLLNQKYRHNEELFELEKTMICDKYK